MTKSKRFRNRLFARFTTVVAGVLVSASALAATGGELQQSGVDLGDQASLQRGAQLYMNYCSGCHSLKYLRYSRIAEDLGLTEEQVMDNLNFTGAKFGEQVMVSMPEANATEWFGKMPPDLSLISQAFDQSVRDITAFLEYAGEPAALKRQSMGVWVILFLAAFTFLAWLLKKEYWRDVH